MMSKQTITYPMDSIVANPVAEDQQIVPLRPLRHSSSDALDRLIIGSSPPMRALKNRIFLAANCSSVVRIYGESGTGKELVARTIHTLSARSKAPFKPINCGAISETLLEPELFGYERGAFTGAVAKYEGLFVSASGGTVFLDEFGETSPAMQVKLLRVLQERVVQPVGSQKLINFDARVVVGSNKNLEQEVRQGRLREDLYYRVNVLSISIPPLRERTSDIPELIAHLLPKVQSKTHFSQAPSLDREALIPLCLHQWPGNIRELENILEVLSLLAGEGGVITAGHVSHVLPGAEWGRQNNKQVIKPQSAQAQYSSEPQPTSSCDHCRRLSKMQVAMAISGDNITKASALLGMKRSAFSRLYKRYQSRHTDC